MRAVHSRVVFRRVAHAALGILTAALSAGCHPTAEPPSKGGYTIDIIVDSDPGHGVAGADLVIGGVKAASTDAQGRASLTLGGAEGDRVEIAIGCPSGYQPPAERLAVTLRRLSPGSRAPSFTARCAPLVRTVVVGIRTENGANLPVLYLGKEIGRTDEHGAAHVVVSAKANDAVTLSLDTTPTDATRLKLRPENPTLTFVAKDKDDFVVLEQKFAVERPARAKPAPTRQGPTRI